MNLNHVENKYTIYGMLFSLSNRIQTIGDKEFKEMTMKQMFLTQLEKNGFLRIEKDEDLDKAMMRMVYEKAKNILRTRCDY